MNISFSKMHGLGNDFIVINAIEQPLSLDSETILRLADRHRGIGCDQILIVETARSAEFDFFYRIFNADGSEVAQCGNGARCFARFVRDQGLTDQDSIKVETLSGPMLLQIEADGDITVNMGVPRFDPSDIPLQHEQRENSYQLTIDDQSIEFGAVSVGNPHAVIRVNDIESAPVATLGPILESHTFFPQRSNIGFIEVVDNHQLNLRVYERGAGETEACGSGACAAMIIARQQGWVSDSVTVNLRGGMLRINWKGEGEPVWMTGPATHVFDGQITL